MMSSHRINGSFVTIVYYVVWISMIVVFPLQIVKSVIVINDAILSGFDSSIIERSSLVSLYEANKYITTYWVSVFSGTAMLLWATQWSAIYEWRNQPTNIKPIKLKDNVYIFVGYIISIIMVIVYIPFIAKSSISDGLALTIIAAPMFILQITICGHYWRKIYNKTRKD